LSLASSIAAAYADADVEGALAWVRGQPSQVEVALLMRLAQTQPQRAVEIALASQHPETVSRASSVVSVAPRSGGVAPVRLADLFLAQPRNAISNQAIQNLIGNWADVDAAGALDWLLSKSNTLPIAVLSGAGNQLMNVPEVAVRYIDRLPAEVRADWLRAVATGYVRKDPAAGIAFIERLSAEPGFD